MHKLLTILLLLLALSTPLLAAEPSKTADSVEPVAPLSVDTVEAKMVDSSISSDRKGPLMSYLDRIERCVADAADCPLTKERKQDIIARLKDKLDRNLKRRDYLQRRLRALKGDISESDAFERLGNSLLKRLEELKSGDSYEVGKPVRK